MLVKKTANLRNTEELKQFTANIFGCLYLKYQEFYLVRCICYP